MKHISLLFQQMSSTMLKIQGAGCLFPDGKICNWLVDDKNRLRIADTKSFVFVDAKGVYSAALPGNEHCGFLTTKKFNPPEYSDKTKARTAESTHAFLLGVNLYVFVTGVQPPNPENGGHFYYDHALFQGTEGQHLKALISALVIDDPRARLSLKEAQHQLFLLAEPELRVVFSDLKKLKVCENDVLMDDYIREKQLQISNAPNLEARERILTEINTTIAALNTNKAFNGVKNIITNLRTEAQKFYNYGKGAKAEKIERALVEVPIAERMTFEKSAHASTQKVMEGLASKRTLGGVKETILTATKEIDLKSAPSTFKKFKEKFKAEVPVAVAKNDIVDAPNRPAAPM